MKMRKPIENETTERKEYENETIVWKSYYRLKLNSLILKNKTITWK